MNRKFNSQDNVSHNKAMKTLVIVLVVLLSIISFAQGNQGSQGNQTNVNVQNYEYYKAQLKQWIIADDSKALMTLATQLEKIFGSEQKVDKSNIKHAELLAEVYFELSNRQSTVEKKKSYCELSLNLAKKIITVDDEDGYGYYFAAMSTATLINYVNVFEKLSLLNEFDGYMTKAIAYLDDRVYKGLAYLGFGIRYMTPPWPLNNLDKAFDYITKAVELVPEYSGGYLQLGYLYEKRGDKDKAKEMFEKVLSMDSPKEFAKAHKENVTLAKEKLSKMK